MLLRWKKKEKRMKYNVLIVDDQILPRQYFESIVNSSENYKVAASIASAKVADVYCIKNPVDLIIMDIVMADGSNGITAAAEIKKAFPKIKILMVTSMPDAELITRAREAGVDSFWYKEVQDAPMLEVMDRTMNGESVFPDKAPSVSLGLASSSDLTAREIDVLRALACGYSNQEIADELGTSINTIRFHLGNLLSKTGFTTRTELAIAVAKSGIAVI